MSEKVKNALTWLVDILESEGIDYQVVGGLAATIHGSDRPVADIDLFIHNTNTEKLLHRVGPHISKPLKHYKEYGWNLEYFQLIYGSQKIEVGLSENAQVESALDGSWHDLKIEFSVSVYLDYQGIRVPVIPKDQLIEYKRLLNRDVDIIDIQQLTAKS